MQELTLCFPRCIRELDTIAARFMASSRAGRANQEELVGCAAAGGLCRAGLLEGCRLHTQHSAFVYCARWSDVSVDDM